MARSNAAAEILGDKPPVLDYTEFTALKRGVFAKKAARAIQLRAEIEELEQELRETREELIPLLVSADVKSVVYEGYTVSLVESAGRSTLDKNAMIDYLIKHDVPSGVIKRAISSSTKLGQPSTTVSFKKRDDE